MKHHLLLPVVLMLTNTLHCAERSKECAQQLYKNLEIFISENKSHNFKPFRENGFGICTTPFEAAIANFKKNGGNLATKNAQGKTLLELAKTANNVSAQQLLEKALDDEDADKKKKADE